MQRTLFKIIKSKLFKGKIIIIYGARQVGKTTLAKMFLDDKSLYLNCDEPDIRDSLTDKSSFELGELIKNHDLIVIDEAQRVKNIGLSLKLIIDKYPQKQIIATGSSSFEISNQIKEPLTGRKFEYILYPFSLKELSSTTDKLTLNRSLEKRMIFGMYPDVVLNDDIDILKNLTESYLYKDILAFQNIKNPDILRKLLQALAMQLGNEVSYNELASLLNIDKNTVANYIDILEKAFIIFRLNPYSRNLRNELKKLRKIYFYDTGIRNSLIKNYNELNIRNDVGPLFENFILIERIKKIQAENWYRNQYFWRTHQQKEIDYVEEYDGRLFGYEFKFSKERLSKRNREFSETYNASIEIITRNNFLDFVL